MKTVYETQVVIDPAFVMLLVDRGRWEDCYFFTSLEADGSEM